MKNSLSKRKLERYSRQIILKDIGILGQKKIINSKVLIVGIGGLGSPVADLLARCGVGYIGAIDHDKVDISNLQRQILYTSKDVGKFKVDIFKRRIKLINRDVKVKILKEKASEKNLNKIVKDFDIIVDGTDNFKTKFLINKFSLPPIPILRPSPMGVTLYIANHFIKLMKFLFKEILPIFLWIFLIFMFFGAKILSGHTTPVAFSFPKGTSTLSPGVNFSFFVSYVNEKLNILGSNTCAFIF